MKKIGLSLVVLVFAFVIPFSSADAQGNGNWDYLGSHPLYYNSTYGWWDTANVYSTGGDILISSDSSNVDTVQLWEYDPGPGNDDYVGFTTLSGPLDAEPFRDINRFVDGSNNLAEFYVRTTYNPYGASIQFWD